MRSLALAVGLVLAGCVTPAPTIATVPGCALANEDRAWLEQAPKTWAVVERDVYALPPSKPPAYLLFDASCAYASEDARTWSATVHNGQVKLPDGEQIPPQVSSFAAPANGCAMMVMALPTIWRAGDVTSELGLDRLMFAVFAHEMTHTRQFADYGARIEALAEKTGVGDDLTDDIIQDRFGQDADFAASVARERELLFAAAAETDVAAARGKAKEAQTLIESRRARYLSGNVAAFGELEDIFLTMEGMGQYAGFAWLSHPKGAGLSRVAAIEGMRRGGRRWSQDEGLAIFLVLDTLRPAWRKEAFADRPRTALQLLAKAVE